VADGAKVIRSLLVRIGVKADDRKLKEFDAQVSATKENLRGLADRAKWAAAGVVAFGAALFANTVATAAHAQTVEQQARALGLATDEYQEAAHVFERAGADTSDIADTLGQLTDRAYDAAGGSKEAAEQFALIGLRADQLKGKDPLELFELLADAVANTSDENKGLAAAMRLLGDDSARKLLPVLRQGKAGIQAMRQEARELGLVLDGKALAASAKFQTQWRTLKGTVESVRREIGLALMPVFGDVIQRASDWIRANRDWIRLRIEDAVGRVEHAMDRLRDLLPTVRQLVTDLFGSWENLALRTAQGTGMLALARVLWALGSVLTLVKAGVVALGAAFGITFWPMLAILAAVVLSVAAVAFGLNELMVYFRGGDSVIGRFIDRFKEQEGVIGAAARAFESFLRLLPISIQLWGLVATKLGEAGTKFLEWSGIGEKAQAGLQLLGMALRFFLLNPLTQALDTASALMDTLADFWSGEVLGGGFGFSAGGALGKLGDRLGGAAIARGAADMRAGNQIVSASRPFRDAAPVTNSSSSQTFAPVITVTGGAQQLGEELLSQARRAWPTFAGGDR
jgi:TP901 family phage tail tape measure protein